MATLMLVRHAQSENRALRSKIWKEVEYDRERFDIELAGRLVPDPPLSELGRIQAKELAECFGPLLADFDEHALVVTSPEQCALETAMSLVRRGLVSRDRFVCQGELFEIGSRIYHRQERPSEVAARLEADFVLTCCEVPSDADYPAQTGGESDDQASARVDRGRAWVESLLAHGTYEMILVITHAHFLTRWLRRWMGVPREQGLAFAHANAGVTMLEWRPQRGLVVEVVNDQTHLFEGAYGTDGDWWRYAGRLGSPVSST